MQMSCGGHVFCVATSRIILSEKRAVEAVESQGVGIAQLFKHFHILPSFYLPLGRGFLMWRASVSGPTPVLKPVLTASNSGATGQASAFFEEHEATMCWRAAALNVASARTSAPTSWT